MDISLNSQNIIQQKTLNKIEELCTQEEPAACIASCPLHVNVKEMIQHILNDKWNDAYKLFSKATPFPKIIANYCDAPCKMECRRSEIGGAIEVNKLEHALLKSSTPSKPPLFLPKKSQSVAIIGGGLSGMAAGLELSKKGYKITIYEKEDKLGGHLWNLNPLREEAINEDIEAMLKFPINVEYNRYIDCDNIVDFKNENSYDAVYLACETKLSGDISNFIDEENNIFVKEGIQNKYSPVFQIYYGKLAATSLDRKLQNVSVMAGREKEGPFKTRLFTNLEPFEEVSPVSPQGEFYTEEEAKKEAERCIQCTCLQCVEKCAFMKNYKSYPKRYVREVYNNLSIAMGIHHANKMINSCALCGQCGSVCPNGLNMADVFLAARNKMVESDKMPPSTFEFALLDMEYSMSDDFFTVRNQQGFSESKYVFFPGCQLPASEPDLVKNVYKDLCTRVEGGVGLLLSCCGIMAHWGGKEEEFKKVIEKIKESVNKLGSPKIITACPNCHKVLRDIAELDTVSIYELFNEIGVPNNKKDDGNNDFYIHHGCGTRNDAKMQQGIHSLLQTMNYNVHNIEEEQGCCGYGGLMMFSNKDLSNKMVEKQIEDNNLESGNIITYCVNCRDRYLSSNVEAYHLLEIAYGDSLNLNRTSPTWSSRQENRAKLKTDLLNDLWGEKIEMNEDMKLYIDENIQNILEERMILRSDIKASIRYGEDTSMILQNPETKHLTVSFRPKNVTFWVEYEPFMDGYKIHNAYSHRMSADNMNMKK